MLSESAMRNSAAKARWQIVVLLGFGFAGPAWWLAPASAAVPARESFEADPFGAALPASGSSGWNGPWQVEAGAPRVHSRAAADPAWRYFGNQLVLDGNCRLSRRLDLTTEGPFAKAGLVEAGLIGKPGRTLYVGFLLQVSAVPGHNPAAADYLRYYACEFKTSGGDEKRVLDIGHDDRSQGGSACFGAASVVNNRRADVEPGQFQSLGPEDARQNQIVVKFTFGPAGQDTVEIYRNPASRSGEPAPAATLHGTFRFDRLALARFVGNSPVLVIDEIRFGTTFAEVLATVDESRRKSLDAQAQQQVRGAEAACRRRLETLASAGTDVAGLRSRLDEIIAAGGRLSPWDQTAAIKHLESSLVWAELQPQVGRLLFVKRHAYQPTHIYTEHSDGPYRPGGGIFILTPAVGDARHTPDALSAAAPAGPGGQVTQLFDARGGICRDPELSFDGTRMLFSYRPSEAESYHIFQMNIDGTGLKQLTDGPFHDLDPFYLPDGRIGCTSTRCKSRTLCFWVQSATLFVMEADGSHPRPLTANNVTEFTPDLLPDGRILFTRWEYLDKSAIFVQSLWSILPDGTGARQVYGNNLIHPVSMLQARVVPGTRKLACTLAAHNGNSYGPLAIVDPAQGVDNPAGILNLAPEVNYGAGCFAPYPVNDRWCLISYGPTEPFGIWLFGIDPPAESLRPGRPDQPLHAPQFPPDLGTYWKSARTERHLLYRDPVFSCVEAIPVGPRPRPPVVASPNASVPVPAPMGTLVLADVHRGLEGSVPPGRIKYLRIVEEIGHRDAQGQRDYQDGATAERFNRRYGNFMSLYASPWEDGLPAPSLQAKFVYGTVPVEADGSAHFIVPADRPVYFQALDQEFNEVQRMRSYIHLQPGERLSCVGCHESRQTAPQRSTAPLLALQREPSPITPPKFGAGPFAYLRLVQPILDRRCVQCHAGAAAAGGVDLAARRDNRGVPVSFSTLVRPRKSPARPPLVHFFDSWWGETWTVPVARPLSFGAAVSRLVQVLDNQHAGYELPGADRERLRLTPDERQVITTWIDLNCPLWDNYAPELHLAREAQQP